jgi:hypothetical protein
MRSVESSILLLLLSFLLCWSPSSAQQQERRRIPPRQPVAGGYSPAKDLEDETVVEAAEFALTVLLSSLNQNYAYSFVPTSVCKPIILEASQQVVAGLNIKLTILLVDEDYAENSSCLGAFAVTVYNRFGDLSVTDWGREYTCEEAMVMMEAVDSSSSEEEN